LRAAGISRLGFFEAEFHKASVAKLARITSAANLALLPPAPVPRRAAGRARRGAELGIRLVGVAGLDDFASLTERLFGQ
jgi:hypothetical protein